MTWWTSGTKGLTHIQNISLSSTNMHSHYVNYSSGTWLVPFNFLNLQWRVTDKNFHESFVALLHSISKYLNLNTACLLVYSQKLKGRAGCTRHTPDFLNPGKISNFAKGYLVKCNNVSFKVHSIFPLRIADNHEDYKREKLVLSISIW